MLDCIEQSFIEQLSHEALTLQPHIVVTTVIDVLLSPIIKQHHHHFLSHGTSAFLALFWIHL